MYIVVSKQSDNKHIVASRPLRTEKSSSFGRWRLAHRTASDDEGLERPSIYVSVGQAPGSSHGGGSPISVH